MSFADKLTFLRILLTPLFVFLLFRFHDPNSPIRYMILLVFGIAVLTDFFDGLVARIKKEKSPIGEIIDPLADKLLLFSSFIFIYLLHDSLPLHFKIPLWLILLVITRDMCLLTGVAIMYVFKQNISIKPSIWGKLTTFFQMLTILTILLDFSMTNIVWTIAAIFTIISGLEYLLRGVKILYGKVNTATS